MHFRFTNIWNNFLFQRTFARNPLKFNYQTFEKKTKFKVILKHFQTFGPPGSPKRTVSGIVRVLWKVWFCEVMCLEHLWVSSFQSRIHRFQEKTLKNVKMFTFFDRKHSRQMTSHNNLRFLKKSNLRYYELTKS